LVDRIAGHGHPGDATVAVRDLPPRDEGCWSGGEVVITERVQQVELEPAGEGRAVAGRGEVDELGQTG
jgi:hypothetical protein